MTMIPVKNLEVVAYANRLEPGALPCKVPPIFRFVGDLARLVFPPFKLIDDQIVGGAIGNKETLSTLIDQGNATLLEKPFPALPSHVLWIEDGVTSHYDPATDHLRKWQRQSTECYSQAKSLILEGKFDNSLQFARKAFALNERRWEALALQAAIARAQNNSFRVEALFKIATSCGVGREEFDAVVRELIPKNSNADLGHSKIQGMALARSTFTFPERKKAA
jgi:hypothetical protein